MEEGLRFILLVLVFLDIVIGGIYATWNLVNHHSHLSAQEKRRNGLEISG